MRLNLILADPKNVTPTLDTDFINEMTKDSFRFAYLAANVRRGLASQIRAMRKQPERRWSQAELAAKMGKPQSVVSRLEDPNYGKMSVNTLLEVANTLNVALLVQFVEWDDFLVRTADVSPSGLSKHSFSPMQLQNIRASNIQSGTAIAHGTANFSRQPFANYYIGQSNLPVVGETNTLRGIRTVWTAVSGFEDVSEPLGALNQPAVLQNPNPDRMAIN